MAIPPVPVEDTALAPVEDAPVAPVEETPAAPTLPAAGTAPWTKDLEERFTDEATRSQVDAYLREKQAPYISKLEQERNEARDKSWVYDELTGEDPAEALKSITSQLFGDEVGDRVAELVLAGADPEEAVEQAKTEIDLPESVRKAVEWAEAQQANAAETAKAAEEQKQMDDAIAAYDTFLEGLKTSDPDIDPDKLHPYVVAYADQLGEDGKAIGVDGALAAYRNHFPKPEVVKDKPPATVGSGASTIHPYRRPGTIGQVFDKMFGDDY